MQLTVVLAAAIAAGTIFHGLRVSKRHQKVNLKKSMLVSVSLFSVTVLATIVFGAQDVMAAQAAAEVAGNALSFGDGLKYIAAALSTGLATIGTGRAVGSVGASAIGAVSEDASILGRTLIFVGMAEGIAIYGMIISILILFI